MFATHTCLTQNINGILSTQSYCHYSAQSCFCDLVSQTPSLLHATNVQSLNTIEIGASARGASRSPCDSPDNFNLYNMYKPKVVSSSISIFSFRDIQKLMFEILETTVGNR